MDLLMEEKIPDSIKKKQSEEVAKETCHNPNSPLKGTLMEQKRVKKSGFFFYFGIFYTNHKFIESSRGPLYRSKFLPPPHL